MIENEVRRRRERALQTDGGTFGGGGVFSAVLLVLMGGFSVAAGLYLRAEQGGPEITAHEVTSWLSTAVVGFVIGVIIVACIRGPQASRERLLRRRFPDAIVMTSSRTYDLVAGLRDWRDAGIPGGRAPKLPSLFTLVAYAEGLRIWVAETGTNSSWLIPWSEISHVVAGSVHNGRGRFPALVAVLNSSGTEQIALPFAVMGAGLGGIFSQNRSAIDELAARTESMRVAQL